MENSVYLIVLFNIISVILASKNNRYTWLFGLIATSLTMLLFYENNHIMSYIYNIYNAIVCIVGFFFWNKSPNDNEKQLKQSNILRLILYFIPLLLIICLVNSLLLHSNNFILDSLGSSTAIFGAYLLVKKDINAWLFWIVGDISYIGLSLLTNDYSYLVIYSVLLVFAIYSFCKNRKIIMV